MFVQGVTSPVEAFGVLFTVPAAVSVVFVQLPVLDLSICGKVEHLNTSVARHMKELPCRRNLKVSTGCEHSCS